MVAFVDVFIVLLRDSGTVEKPFALHYHWCLRIVVADFVFAGRDLFYTPALSNRYNSCGFIRACYSLLRVPKMDKMKTERWF